MSIASAQARAPLASAPASESLGPLSVSTVRLWTGSEWVSSSAAPVAKAVEIASIRSRSRPSEKFGTASSTADSAQTTRAPSRTTGSPSTVTSGFITRQSR